MWDVQHNMLKDAFVKVTTNFSYGDGKSHTLMHYSLNVLQDMCVICTTTYNLAVLFLATC